MGKGEMVCPYNKFALCFKEQCPAFIKSTVIKLDNGKEVITDNGCRFVKRGMNPMRRCK